MRYCVNWQCALPPHSPSPFYFLPLVSPLQKCLEEIQVHQLEIIRVLFDANERLIVERAQLCSAEMDRVLCVCKRRKGELQKILEQCRIWERLRGSIEVWLIEGWHTAALRHPLIA